MVSMKARVLIRIRITEKDDDHNDTNEDGEMARGRHTDTDGFVAPIALHRSSQTSGSLLLDQGTQIQEHQQLHEISMALCKLQHRSRAWSICHLDLLYLVSLR